MAKLRRLIPFGVWPANWGLSGERLELARAEYYFTGEDLAREKAKIQKPSGVALEKELLRIDEEYGKVTPEEAAYKQLILDYPDEESTTHKVEKIKLDLKFGKINQNEFEKQTATAMGDPWFKIIGGDYHLSGDTTQLAFELDWNDIFVEGLIKNGWSGRTDEEVVDLWFSRTCRETIMDDLEQVVDEEPMGGSAFARTRKERQSNGRSQYS